MNEHTYVSSCLLQTHSGGKLRAIGDFAWVSAVQFRVYNEIDARVHSLVTFSFNLKFIQFHITENVKLCSMIQLFKNEKQI